MNLGRYTLIRKVASGGMAEVYAARSHGISGFEKKVAIKKILPQFSLNRRFVDMLVDEAKITVSLTHPNIAQIYELGLEGDTYYIVMEYVDGRPLNRLMQKLDQDKRQNVPVEHAAHIMAEVAKGLHHAHNQKDARSRALNIVHRDISPQNVLLAYSGDVKLIDFGIARAVGRSAQTNVGTIKGKLRYLAPEIAMGEEADHRADIYCCGIVLFEMLTGEAMFAPRTDVEAIEIATAAKVRSPRSRNPKVPEDLDEIVMRALRKDRTDRYQSAKQLHTALRRFLNKHFPAYVGSELGDLMQEYFGDDFADDRRLDALAEQVIERIEGERADDTLGVRAGELAGLVDQPVDTKSARYKPVVTRTGIETPDSGAAPEDGVDDRSDDSPEFEPTQRAMNPLPPEDLAGVEPTVTGRAPARPDSTGTDPLILPTDDTLAAPSPATAARPGAPPPSSAPVARVAPLKPTPWFYIATAVVAVILAIWAGFLAVAPDETARDPQPPIAPIAPLAVAAPQVTLNVAPVVPVDVLLDGEVVRMRVEPPVRLEDLKADHEYTIAVRSPGFATVERKTAFASDTETSFDVILERLTGSIVLSDVSGAQVSASAGRVDGNRILDIPVGEPVTIRVTKNGRRTWEETVTVDPGAPLEVTVPRTAAVRRGELFVNSRPYSVVYINGRKYGRTPRTVRLPPGSYKVQLKREGRTTNLRAKVNSGRKTDLTYRWPR